MILTCPECQKQFNVPSAKIGEEGRTVRCGACKNTWHVGGGEDNDDILEKTDIDATLDKFREEQGDLNPQDDGDPTSFQSALSKEMGQNAPKQKPKLKESKAEKNKILSVMVGIILLLVFLLASIPFKSNIMEHWPASEGLYRLVGLNVPVKGQSLVFDRVQVRGHENKIEVMGFVINLAKTTEEVPRVEVSIAQESGKNTRVEVFALSFNEIEGEASRPFRKSMTIPESAEGVVENITLKFIQ